MSFELNQKVDVHISIIVVKKILSAVDKNESIAKITAHVFLQILL